MDDNVVVLQLPLKAEYLQVLRTTTGVIAGTISFTYDQIMQLRVVISEVFDLAINYVEGKHPSADVHNLAVRFATDPDKIEILITGPKNYTDLLDREEGKESQALLRGLMDEVEFGAEEAGESVIRMVKYKSADKA